MKVSEMNARARYAFMIAFAWVSIGYIGLMICCGAYVSSLLVDILDAKITKAKIKYD